MLNYLLAPGEQGKYILWQILHRVVAIATSFRDRVGEWAHAVSCFKRLAAFRNIFCKNIWNFQKNSLYLQLKLKQTVKCAQ